MPWLEEGTLFVGGMPRGTEVRRYEPGVGEGAGVQVVQTVEVVESVEVVEVVQVVEVQGGHGGPPLVGPVELVVPLEGRRDGEVHGHRLVGQHGDQDAVPLEGGGGQVSALHCTTRSGRHLVALHDGDV